MAEWRISQGNLSTERIFSSDSLPQSATLDDAKYTVCKGDPRNIKCESDRDIRLRCLQGWFFRSSWSDKFSFVMDICDLTNGVHVLEQVLKCVDGVYSKDVIDSFARDRIIFPYDIVPTDDKRAITALEMLDVRQEDTLWFINLDSATQVEVIVKLLKLGGGGLIFHAYKQIQRLYNERKEMNMVLSAVDASIRELLEKEQAEDANDQQPSEKSAESSANDYTSLKEEQMTRRNIELNEFKKKYGLGNGKKREATEVVDYIQVLPMWLNRKIMLYLSETKLGELKRTGKYWSKMIEDALRESAGRVSIDTKIGRMGLCRTTYKEESIDAGEDTEDVVVLGRNALLQELHLRHSDVARARTESKAMKDAKMEVTIWEEMCFEGIVCSVNDKCKLLAAATPNKTIMFYSLRTGARMKNTITGMSSLVTSMAVHDEGFHVIVGFEEGALICMNIRKNERTIAYRGHSGAVLRIHASDDKLISAGEDNIIRHFDLWSGLCLFCVNIYVAITSMLVLKRDLLPRRVITGTAQGRLIFIDLRKKRIYREVAVHEREVRGMVEAGNLLLTHSADKTIRLWSTDRLEAGRCKMRPFASIRLKSMATAVATLGNEIFAACADGRLRLICKLTGAATRVVEVTQKKPIAGIYVMQEKDTTKMIMWHEGGIEMRSFSSGKVPRKKVKATRKDTAAALSPRKLFSLLPPCSARYQKPLTVKRYKPTNAEDREMVDLDKSCTVTALRNVGTDRTRIISRDVFTEMIKAFRIPKTGYLATFSRLQNNEPPSGSDGTSIQFTVGSSIY